MDNQKSLSIQENRVDYWKPTPDRRWEVCFDYKTKVYLSDEEREFFLQEIGKDVKIIQIKDLTLTPKFQYILPVMEKKVPEKYEEIYENGLVVGYRKV